MDSNSTIQPEVEATATATARNWLELPTEVMSMILLKLGAVEILTSAQNVCSSWRNICKDPLMWRVIDMSSSDPIAYQYNLEIMCRHAVDRSCGQLVDINIEYFGTDDLILYIAESSNQLRRLRVVACDDIEMIDEGLAEAVPKLPLLEHLEILLCSFYVSTLITIGRCCPLLKSLKLHKKRSWDESPSMANDGETLAIAETMPKLQHLQIFDNGMTNSGLHAILDGCPDLESLDLRRCLNLNLAGQLGQKCAEKIKILHLPNDPIDDYEFASEYIPPDFEFEDSEEESFYRGFPVMDSDVSDYGDFSDYDDFTRTDWF